MKLKGVVRGLKKGLVTALAVTMFATSLPSVPAFATEGTENTFFEETDVFEAAETDAVVTDVELEEENIAQEADGQETIADENATENVEEIEIADDTDVSETVDEEADAEEAAAEVEEEVIEEEVIEEEVEVVEEAALALQNTVSLVPDRYPAEIDINDVATTMWCGEINGECIDGNANKIMINTSEKSLDDVWMNVYFMPVSDVAVYDYYFVIKDSKGDAANSWKLGRRGISLDIDWSESNDITYYYDIVPREIVNITVDYKSGTGISYASGNNIGKIRGLWNGAYIREKLPNAKHTDGVGVDDNCDKTKTAAKFSNYKVDPFAKLFLIEEDGVAYRIKSLDVTCDGKAVETPPYDLIPEGISYIDISDFKSGDYTILVELEPVISKPFEWVKLAGKTSVTQSLGKKVAYKVTNNLGVTFDENRILVRYTDADGSEQARVIGELPSSLDVSLSNDTITIFQNRDKDGDFIENLTIDFASNGGRKSVKVLFNDSYLANAVATAKVVSASDIALNLELSTNGISAWEDGNTQLFYRVGYKQTSGDQLVDNVKYIPVGTGKAENYPLYVLGNSKDDEGTGRAEDFKLSTTLVVGFNNDNGTIEEISASSKTSVLAKVSTKNPAYVTSFSLKAVKAKINSSERGQVLVAKGVFDKNASYLNLDSLVKIVDCPKGVTEGEARTALAPYTVSDSLYINASNSEGKIPAGVYTLEVSSEKNEGSNMRAATARFKLTVLQDIILEDVTAKLSTNSVAKKTKGNATVKTIVNYPVIAGKTYKPAKISYAIVAFSTNGYNKILDKQITINEKTGVVSVSPKYVVSASEDENKFGVMVLMSDKYGTTDNRLADNTLVVKDVAETIVIDSVKLKATDGNYVDLSAPVTTDVVNGKEIVALDKEGNAIDTDSLAITVAGAKLDYRWIGGYKRPVIDSPKLGTVTVTAKAADGGNSTAKLVAKTKYATPDDIVLGVDNSYDDEVEVLNGKEYIPGFGLDGKPVGNDYEFLKIKVKVKFGEEIIDSFADAAPLTNIAVSVSSGGILTKNVAGGYYTLEIKRDKVAEIAIKDKTSGNIYKYTFTNEYFGNRGVVKSLKAVSKLYATDALSNSDSASQVVWIKPNVKLDEKYVLVLDYIVDDELVISDNTNYDATKGAFGVGIYGKIPKGKLKCYGFIMDSTKLGVLGTPSLEPPVPGDFIVDGPISFTITTTAAPTYSVADTIVKTKQSAYGTITNVIPKATNCKIVGIDNRPGMVPYRNAVVNGKVNNAINLWTVVYNEKTGNLDVVLKDNYPLREIDKADLIQYVTLEVEDVFGYTQYVQIKVTLNPAAVKECTGEHTIEGTHCTKCGFYTGDN